MKKRKIRLGLIGCGAVVQYAHLPQLLRDKEVDLAAVADPSQTQIDGLLEKAGLSRPGHADYREMIRRENLDAVIICTPHSMHYEQARFALDHGLHVMVEKPLTIRPDHAVKLVELAERKSRFLVVAYQRFFQEKSVYARELIAAGRIGEVRGVACCIAQNWGNVSGWRADPALSGGGFMMDTGSHLVSAMLRITGLKPVKVSAATENYGKPVDLSSVVTVWFSNGALGSLSFFGCTHLYEEHISIHGSEGHIELRASHGAKTPLLLNNEPVEIPSRIKPATPYSSLVHWIRAAGKGYAPPQTAIDTIRLTDAAYRSERAGRPVRIRG